MWIVIDISEDDYRKVQDGRASVNMMRKVIRNGTPLDKIRAEIEQMPSELTADGRRMIRRVSVFRVIDKYKGESEE